MNRGYRFQNILNTDELLAFLQSRRHNVYHHFTTVSTLIKIIENNSWRFSVGSKMNDQHEYNVKSAYGLRDKIYSTCFSFGDEDNSPGGSVIDGMAIFDTMRYISCDVVTICVGLAASMGAFLLAAGTKGKRFALPHSEIMIHQVLGGFHGQATDIEIHAKNTLRIKKMMNTLLAEFCDKPVEQVTADCERDNFMTAEEAKAYGLIDEVYASRKRGE